LRATRPQLVEQLRTFQVALWTAEPGQAIKVPEAFATTKGASGLSPDRKQTLEALARLAGSEVRLVDAGKGDVHLAGAARLLPADFAPAIVLDASGRVRATYQLWEDRVGGLQRLPAAHNDYQDLTIHLWSRPTGRDALGTSAVQQEIAAAIADEVSARASDDWLIIHYKGAEEVVEAVRGLLAPERAERVQGLTWGLHHGTNDYAHVPNIVIVGQLTYGRADYPALGSAGIGGGAPDLTDEQGLALQRGE